MELRHERMNDVFEKWHVIGAPFEAAFHRMTGPMNAIHDHPWPFTTHILSGGYVERIYSPFGSYGDRECRAGMSFDNAATHIHQITEILGDECWTLILPGPFEQKPGFWEFREDGAWRRDWDGEWYPFKHEPTNAR